MGRTRIMGQEMTPKPQPGEADSPTWADVGEMMRYVEREHKCRVTWEWGTATVGKRGMVGNVIAYRVEGRNNWYACQRLGLFWPTHSARTMPALLVSVLWRLCDAMHDYDELPIFRDQMPQATLPLPPT